MEARENVPRKVGRKLHEPHDKLKSSRSSRPWTMNERCERKFWSEEKGKKDTIRTMVNAHDFVRSSAPRFLRRESRQHSTARRTSGKTGLPMTDRERYLLDRWGSCFYDSVPAFLFLDILNCNAILSNGGNYYHVIIDRIYTLPLPRSVLTFEPEVWDVQLVLDKSWSIVIIDFRCFQNGRFFVRPNIHVCPLKMN